MRVLHLISSGGMYGAEAVLLNLSAALNANADNRSLLGIFAHTAQPNLQLHEAAQKANIESHLIPCHGQIDVQVPARIRALVDRTRADIVHAHGYKADIYACIALRKANLPLVSTCHNWLDNDMRLGVYGVLDRWFLRRFDAVVAVSDEVRNRLLRAGVQPNRIRLIRNGVDLRPFAAGASIREAQRSGNDGLRTGLRTGLRIGLRIGLVGRLSPEKGVDLFLHAAAQVLAQRPATRFFIVGDGPERAALEALIAQSGLGNSVTLLGRTNDMPAFYSSIDVLASSSRIEGLPMALLEGMASRLPIVATAVGAVPQVIHDGQTGLLVPAGDPSALAAAIARLIDDPPLRDSLGGAAQQWVANEFSADRMAREYLDLYRQARAERTSRVA